MKTLRLCKSFIMMALLLAFGAGFTGCLENDDQQLGEIPEIKLSEKTLNFTLMPNEPQTLRIRMTGAGAWTVEAEGYDSDVIDIQPSYGTESADVEIVPAPTNAPRQIKLNVSLYGEIVGRQILVAKETVLVNQTADGSAIEPNDGLSPEAAFTVAEAIAKAQEIGDVNSEETYYIKGVISSVTEAFSAQYGNSTFEMTDKNKSDVFTAYRILYLGNKKWTTGDTNVKVGDEVIVCGKIINFKGNTPETVTNTGYLYSLNGVTGSGSGGNDNPGGNDEPAPEGTGATPESPFNVAQIIAKTKSLGADETSSESYYFKGKISSITENYTAQYGNATYFITDGSTSETFYVYRSLYLGNVKYTSGTLLNVGDEVVVYGKVTNFKGNTPETVQGSAYLYMLNGSTGGDGGNDNPGGNTGDTNGNGTKENPYTIADLMQLYNDSTASEKVWVKGTILGTCTDVNFESFSEATGASASNTNIVIGDNTNKVPVQLPAGAVRNALNLQANPANLGKEVVVYGTIEKYFKVAGIKNVTDYVLDGASAGDNVPTDAKAVTVSEFNAAAVSTTQLYELTGKVSNIKSTEYGNFDLVDDTGSVYVYGLTKAYVATNDKSFASLGVGEGDKIKIHGFRGDYNGQIEVMNAWLIEIVEKAGQSGGNTGGDNTGGNTGGDSGNTGGNTDPVDPTPTPGDGAYTLIDNVANLTAGTYFMAGYSESYTGSGSTTTYAPYSYHIWTGTLSSNNGNADLNTVNYQYANGTLTINPNLSERDAAKGTAVAITLEAVAGKTNTYYIKCNGQYLSTSDYTNNRKMQLTATAAEWTVEAHEKGGIKLTTTSSAGSIILGTGGATYDLLRSYKSPASSLTYGVCFFKVN